MREAFVNLIIHADYLMDAGVLKVIKRNKGFGDNAGSGFPTILDTWKTEGWVEPELVEDTNLNQVTLVLKMTETENKNVIEISEKRIRELIPEYSKKKAAKAFEIMKMISENSQITIDEMRIALDVKQTNESIKLFRSTDEEVANIINSKFVRTIVLPEKGTDYEKLFREMGFDEKAIAEKRVHIKTSDGYTMEYTDGEQVKQMRYDELRFYQMTVQTECIAVKMECLWNSDDVYCYPDKKRVLEYIPALQASRFASVSNNVLAKAEIPFLIFERNRGKCFIEKY